MVQLLGGASTASVKEAVLYAFDDVALPFRRNLMTHLIPGKSQGRSRIVVAKGPPDAHDESVHYYGTTVRVGDELRMWYIGRVGANRDLANMEGCDGRLCYAVSRDGVNWEKPSLGLVQYNGSTDNNLVNLPGEPDIMAGVVLHDLDDADANRRFKLIYETGRQDIHCRMCVAYSPDGLRWTPSPANPVGPRLEPSGLIKWNGCYYVNGQGPGQPGLFRKLHTYASYDFEHWSPASALGLMRSPILEGPSREDISRTGEEVHLGAALHHRGNVILGICGQWHGHATGDRRLVPIDLGLLISHDGMHFHEPIRDFKFIAAREEPESTIGWAPALVQGQGMENVGDQTLYWYSLWRRDGQVRLTTWERDRLGYVNAVPPSVVDPRQGATMISCPLRGDGAKAQVFLNVSGLGEYASVRVEVLDLEFRPVAGFSGEDASVVRQPGLRVPVRWGGRDALPASEQPLRLAVHFGPVSPECVRPEDIRLYTLYVNES